MTAVAFNEKILDECGKNPTNTADQDILIQIAMDFIEKQHSHVHLNRKYKILERSHKGSAKLIKESLFQAFQTKDETFNENLENVMKTFAPLATDSPESLIGQLHNPSDQSETVKSSDKITDKLSGITLNTKPVKRGLIEEVSNVNVTLPEPIYDLSIVQRPRKCFYLKINLPGVKSVTECELDISKVEKFVGFFLSYILILCSPKGRAHSCNFVCPSVQALTNSQTIRGNQMKRRYRAMRQTAVCKNHNSLFYFLKYLHFSLHQMLVCI